MPRRACLGCGRPTTGSRCPTCKVQQHHQRYGNDWPQRSAQAIALHRRTHGDWCPGWKKPAHPSTDLTLDHDGFVCCRSCNARKRNLGDG